MIKRLPLGPKTQRLLDTITAEPGISRVDLARKLGFTSVHSVASNLDTLEDREAVHHVEEAGAGKLYVLRYYPGPAPSD